MYNNNHLIRYVTLHEYRILLLDLPVEEWIPEIVVEAKHYMVRYQKL